MSFDEKAIAAAHAAIVEEVGDHLRWNVCAYGKAWTEEDEDTEFIVGEAAKKALEAAVAALRPLQDGREGLGRDGS